MLLGLLVLWWSEVLNYLLHTGFVGLGKDGLALLLKVGFARDISSYGFGVELSLSEVRIEHLRELFRKWG